MDKYGNSCFSLTMKYSVPRPPWDSNTSGLSWKKNTFFLFASLAPELSKRSRASKTKRVLVRCLSPADVRETSNNGWRSRDMAAIVMVALLISFMNS